MRPTKILNLARTSIAAAQARSRSLIETPSLVYYGDLYAPSGDKIAKALPFFKDRGFFGTCMDVASNESFDGLVRKSGQKLQLAFDKLSTDYGEDFFDAFKLMIQSRNSRRSDDSQFSSELSVENFAKVTSDLSLGDLEKFLEFIDPHMDINLVTIYSGLIYCLESDAQRDIMIASRKCFGDANTRFIDDERFVVGYEPKRVAGLFDAMIDAHMDQGPSVNVLSSLAAPLVLEFIKERYAYLIQLEKDYGDDGLPPPKAILEMFVNILPMTRDRDNYREILDSPTSLVPIYIIDDADKKSPEEIFEESAEIIAMHPKNISDALGEDLTSENNQDRGR